MHDHDPAERRVQRRILEARLSGGTVDVRTQVASAGAAGFAGFAGNILLGGIIGMGADAATGATLEHVPNPVSATLVPISRPPAAKPNPVRPEGPPSS